MELILAIVVAGAVIFFGALISMGNERQRKAIDNLREQVTQWAIQDLKIKRENLARDIKIVNPFRWLNDIVAKVCGYDPHIQSLEFLEQPQALVCVSSDNTTKIVLSLLSPKKIHQMNHAKHNQLVKYTNRNPLITLPRKTEIFEVTVLNGGLMFDLELNLVWKSIAGQNIQQAESLWVYFIKET